VGKRGGPSSTTIRDPERAAELARLKAAADRRRKEAAEQAAAQPAHPPSGKPATPVSPYVTQSSVAQAVQAGAAHSAARSFPPSSRVELERLAPSWPGCRGYLETVDADTIRTYGIREYLRHTWGGERFKVTVVDADGETLWTAADVFVSGPPRQYGTPIEAPRPIPSSIPYYSPAPATAAPVPAVAANPTPAAPPAGGAELVALVRRLADKLDAAEREIDRLREHPPAAAPAAPGQDIGAVFTQARSTLAAAREFADEVDAVAGPPAAAPQDDDRHSPIAREVMRSIARGIGDSVAGAFVAGRNNGNGNGGAHGAGVGHAGTSDAGASGAVEAELVE